jgi:hypothetical protein
MIWSLLGKDCDKEIDVSDDTEWKEKDCVIDTEKRRMAYQDKCKEGGSWPTTTILSVLKGSVSPEVSREGSVASILTFDRRFHWKSVLRNWLRSYWLLCFLCRLLTITQINCHVLRVTWRENTEICNGNTSQVTCHTEIVHTWFSYAELREKGNMDTNTWEHERGESSRRSFIITDIICNLGWCIER